MKTLAKIILILLSLVSVFLSGYSLYGVIEAFSNGLAILVAILYWIYAGISIIVNITINLIIIKQREFRILLYITLGALALGLISVFIGLVIVPIFN